MPQYALRCIEADIPQLLINANILGVLDVVNGQVIMRNGGCWDVIGYKRVGEPPLEGQTDNRPFLEDANGNKYVHINASTPVNIGERAAELSLLYPEIAQGLAQLSRFFITGQDGQAVWPAEPMRCFL